MNLFQTIVAYAEPAADTAGQAAGAAGTAGGVAAMITTFLPLIAVMVLLYLMMIRPQRKKEKELKKQIDAMKIGDKIVTIGGIIGKVQKIKDNTVTIETGNVGTQTEKSYLKIERDAIRTVEQKLSN
ncbi:MAG: preprotein translocase subunit YajC [Clostridiales bacterium]|nr:preprotein translocase subunit YajC [Clostridiales bacterium]